MSRSYPLGALLREANALRRQSALLHKVRPRALALHPSGEDIDVVFLIHGVLATAGVFGPIEDRLRAAGVHHLASFTYHPLRTIASISAELRREVRRIPVRARIHIIGHSLGGIVARHFVQEGGGASRVCQTFSLASPFQGTEIARWVPGSIGRELSPGSPMLALLSESARQPRDVRHTSFVASEDVMVVPPMSAAFPHGDVIVIRAGHNGLLFDRGLADTLVKRIVSHRAVSAA